MNQFPHWSCAADFLMDTSHPEFCPRSWVRLGQQVVFAALLVSAAHAQSPKRLWVLQEPQAIVDYDAATWVARRTLKIPRRLLEHPEFLSINAKGQMVFLPPNGVYWASGEIAAAGDRAWFWDGQQAKEWMLEGKKIPGSSASKPTLTQTAMEWFLSVREDALFRFEKVLDQSGLERSVRPSSQVWRSGGAGDSPELITSLSVPGWCECTTGTCSESCPEWSFWAPDGVVDECFLVTRFTPGQLESTYHESLLYQRSGETWLAKKLPQPIERPLTAREKGEMLVAAIPDGGCCGWENVSSDQMLLVRNGKVSVLYDEFNRYNNRNYDVSFYVSDARFAPGGGMLAYTIASTAGPGNEIRLSSEGKENSVELTRIRKAITGLPAVEVLQLAIPSRPSGTIPQAALVGWVSDQEIFVAKDGRLAVYDTRGRKSSDTTIRVRSAADAFLR